MVEFVVQGKVFRIQDKYALLSDYLRAIMDENWNSPKDEEGRYILDLDKEAFQSYKSYLEGNDFKLNESVAELFDLMGVHNEYEYPFGYWKGKIVDDLVRDNWNIFLLGSLRSYPIKNTLRHDGDIGDYYLVGDAVLYMAGILDGMREIHIISEKDPIGMVVGKIPPNVDMDKHDNWNKSPFVDNPHIRHEKLNGRSLQEICYSGICDADLVVYSSKDNQIYCTNRSYNALKRKEVWFEPDKLGEIYSNRLVVLKSQGFKIRLPFQDMIKINRGEEEPSAESDIYSENEGEQDDYFVDVETTEQLVNGAIYLNSIGYKEYKIINITDMDNIIAAMSGIIFRRPDYYERDINYVRNPDADVTDLYLQSRYIVQSSILGDISLIEYKYNKHIADRDFNTPDWFGFKDYPKLYRDLVYLNNMGHDELVSLGGTRDIYEHDYIMSGSKIAIDLFNIDVSLHSNYVIRFNGKDDNNTMLPVSYHESSNTYYLNNRRKDIPLREAVKYSKIDLEQIGVSVKDGGVYCSLLFLYAYHNRIHTIIKESRLNVIHRMMKAYSNNISFYAPNILLSDDNEDVLYITDALMQLAMYEGDYKTKNNNLPITEDDMKELDYSLGFVPDELKEKARIRAIEYLKSVGNISKLAHYTGIGFKYISHKDYNLETLIFQIGHGPRIFIYPFDHYGTIGSGNHELHEL